MRVDVAVGSRTTFRPIPAMSPLAPIAEEGTSVDLFVEGPTPEWSLPLPEPSGPAAGTRHFTFHLDGLPPGANADGAPLTFTVVSPNDAIEVVTPLD